MTKFKIVYRNNSYTLPDSIRFRGHEYEVSHSQYSEHKDVVQKFVEHSRVRTGNAFIVKAFPANESENGKPVLYVKCGRVK